MPVVDPKKLKRLMVTEMLVPFAMKRRLSGGQLADLAERAMRDKRFDLSASSDDFAALMNEDEATDWAIEFERAGTAPHLFNTQSHDTSNSEEMFGDVPMSQVEEMSAEARLRLANEVEAEQRHAKKKH